jgi:hypothetical protein
MGMTLRKSVARTFLTERIWARLEPLLNFESMVQVARLALWSDQGVAWQQVTGEGSVQPNSEAK